MTLRPLHHAGMPPSILYHPDTTISCAAATHYRSGNVFGLRPWCKHRAMLPQNPTDDQKYSAGCQLYFGPVRRGRTGGCTMWERKRASEGVREPTTSEERRTGTIGGLACVLVNAPGSEKRDSKDNAAGVREEKLSRQHQHRMEPVHFLCSPSLTG